MTRLGQSSRTNVGVVMALACLLVGCGCPNLLERGIFSATAPDGSALVYVTQINTPAGSSFKYEVSLHRGGGARQSSNVIWRSNGCAPVYVFWVTDRLIEVHLESAQVNPKCTEELLEASRSRYLWGEYELRVVPIRSLYKRDLLASSPEVGIAGR